MTAIDEHFAISDKMLKRVKKMTPAQRQKLTALAVPRVVEPYFVHIPHPKQQLFLSITAREAMYGGAAGGGKSDALLMAAAQYVDVPGYSALILRRTWPDLNAPGAILDRARSWWAGLDVKIRDGGRIFEFPSGARIQFGYLQHDKDKFKFQSAEYQFVGFDELTQFPEAAYTYMFSRVRRPQVSCLNCSAAVLKNGAKWRHATPNTKCPDLYPDPKVLDQYQPSPQGVSVFEIPLRVRSATNPGGYGHEWVRGRFVDQKTRIKTAFFVPASLRDNPSLDRDSYRKNLEFLSPTDRERLMNGDWEVYDDGEMFEREWFNVVNVSPVDGMTVRYWDKAATEGGGDYTVGTKLRKTPSGVWYVEDVIRGQWSSHKTSQIIRQTAAIDGTGVPIRMEQEPGSSGKDVIDYYTREILQGYNFKGDRVTGSKPDRAAPFASQAEAGNVKIVAAQWNKAWLDELCLFPVGAHDDQVDSVSGGANFLSFTRRSRLLV